MQIFNVQIFGDDALEFLSWTKEQQKNWILNYTNQTSDTEIDNFLDNPIRNEEGECLTCGKLSNTIVRYDSNISENNVNAVATDSNGIMVEKSSSGNSIERPKSTKGGKS